MKPKGFPPYEVMYFRPLVDFERMVLGHLNSYLAGMTYTIRPGNYELFKAVKEWRKQGLVDFVPDARPPAVIEVKGEVF